jgi:hypothetical protein
MRSIFFSLSILLAAVRTVYGTMNILFLSDNDSRSGLFLFVSTGPTC